MEHVVRAEGRAAGVRDLPAVVGAAGAVERAAAHHLPVARVVPVGVAERVVVVVRQSAQVAELVGEDALTRALGLRGATASRVRPVVRRGQPGRPRDVARRRPVRDRVAGGVQHRAALRSGRSECGRDFLPLLPEHLAELLPRRRLVVTGGDVEDVVVSAQRRRAADRGTPERTGGGADVAAAGVAGGTDRVGLAADAAVELPEPELVQVAGHRVGAERLGVHADAAVRVLEPVAVQRHPAVELVRGRVVLVHPLVDVRRRDRRPARLRVPERMRLGRLADQERLVREVDQDDRRAVLHVGAVRGRVVVGRVPVRNLVVVGPGQVRLVDPVLCVDRLEQRMVRELRRRRGGRRHRDRGREHEECECGEAAHPEARSARLRGRLSLHVFTPGPSFECLSPLRRERMWCVLGETGARLPAVPPGRQEPTTAATFACDGSLSYLHAALGRRVTRLGGWSRPGSTTTSRSPC